MSEPSDNSALKPLSVVIPVCDEEGSIETLLKELLQALGPRYALEVVLVDDGSVDTSPALVEKIAKEDSRVRLIRHAKRSGKSAALRTGMEAAKNLWVATIDGDGENNPADIINMVDEVDLDRVEAVGLVCGIRKRRTAGKNRLIASRIANWIRRNALKDDCPDTACGMKVIPRTLFLAFPFFDGLHRYLPALSKHYGYETRHVMIEDRPRFAGASKYTNFGRAKVGIVDLLGVMWLMRRTSVSRRPTVPIGE